MASASLPAHWMSAALDPPRAGGDPPVTGKLRVQPEDFVVDEDLGFSPDGEGPHWLMRVRKRGANTEFVARELARHARLPAHEVGFAGLKDRNAVTSQWFTVPRGKTVAEHWTELRHEEFQVLEAHAHRRKLKRGALAGNRFQLRIRDLNGDVEALRARIAAVGARGVPNFFGAQRFGRDGNNLHVAAAWAESGAAPRSRSEQSFALSAARSLIFNVVLSARVRRADWDALLPGDVANLDGSGSVFAVGEVDAVLERRLREGDVHPTGPMWGSGSSMAGAAVLDLESAAARECMPLPGLLERAGMSAERRSLRVRVQDLRAELDGDVLVLGFGLPAGAFATTVLREILRGPDHDRDL